MTDVGSDIHPVTQLTVPTGNVDSAAVSVGTGVNLVVVSEGPGFVVPVYRNGHGGWLIILGVGFWLEGALVGMGIVMVLGVGCTLGSGIIVGRIPPSRVVET